jgi:Ice-binding-like
MPAATIEEINEKDRFMFDFRRTSLSLLAAGLLTFAGIGTSVAATHNTARDSLTVKVTKAAGIVWGTVTVEYMLNGSMHTIGRCHQTTCHFSPPHMVQLHLLQEPVNSTTWPFNQWKLTNGGKSTMHHGGKLSFVIKNGAATVLAVYKLKTGRAAVNLGSSGNFTILAKSGISTTGTTSIVGAIGVSPAAATYITGFGLTLDRSHQFATSSLVRGKVYAANYAPPTPTKMTTAVGDMQTAYKDAAGRTNPTATELGAGNIGGRTITPGLYKWSSGVTIPTSLSLSGGANAVWIFQIAKTLNVGNGTIINLKGGAQAKNIFWQVAGKVTLGTTSSSKGTILSKTAIVMNSGAKLKGRALAQTAVTLIADSVTR